jgi:hypothetical protein
MSKITRILREASQLLLLESGALSPAVGWQERAGAGRFVDSFPYKALEQRALGNILSSRALDIAAPLKISCLVVLAPESESGD